VNRNRIGETFARLKAQGRSGLIPFLAAGDPSLDATEQLVYEFEERGADVVAQTVTRVVTISAQALQHASDACRMHFYQGFLDVIAGRLADANARLASL